MGFFVCRKISTKEQYDAVFLERKVIHSRGFKLFWKINNKAYARIGVSVAKRNIARAVDRNKLKRLTKESFRHNIALLPAVDIVLIIKKEAISQTNNFFFAELEAKWQQLTKILKTYDVN